MTQQHDESKEDVPKSYIKDCNYCDHEKRKCPAFGQTCGKCGVKNHFTVNAKPKIKSLLCIIKKFGHHQNG